MWQTALLLFALFVQQAPADYAKAVYIEDVVPEPSQSRIVSGWDAKPGQHPHQAMLRMVNNVGGVLGCGGSVVHREWVITSAHCTAIAITIVVRAGVTHMATPEYMFETNVWFNYPTFDDFRPTVVQPNDIALLQLQRPVAYSKYLQPIRVQPSRDAFRDYNGLRVIASGFGRTWTNGSQPEVLNWVYLTAVSNQNCRNTFGSLITDNTICARFYNVTSQSICQGDSGGPLIHEDANGARTLIGVSSFVAGGDFGCHSGLPGGFIRPGPFLSWFKEVSGIDFENLVEEDESTTAPPPTTTPSPPDTTISPSPPDTTTTPSPPDTTTTPSPPSNITTPAPPTPEEPEDSESDEGSNEEDNDLDLLKRLEVKVKVKVRLSKFARNLANQE